MTKTATTNYGSCAAPGNAFNKRISADTDTFDRNDIDALGAALEEHDHSTGKGAGLAVDAAAATGSLRTLGTGATQAATGNHTHNSAQAGSAVGSTSGPTTTSSSSADIPEMSVTLTTTGGNLLATAMIVLVHSTSSTAFLVLDLDGSGVSTSFDISNTSRLCTVIHRWSGVAAGSHTVKLRWAVSAATLTGVTTMREIMVEEVR